MDHRYGHGKPFEHPDTVPLITGSFADAVTTLHAEVERALTSAVLPWECDLRHRIDLVAIRAGARAHLAGVVAPEALHDVLLVVQELVDNAYQHTGTPRRLRITHRSCTVRIEVTDAEADPPVLHPPSPTDTGKRGILIVHRLSRGWGVLPDDDGKTVWAELPGHP